LVEETAAVGDIRRETLQGSTPIALAGRAGHIKLLHWLALHGGLNYQSTNGGRVNPAAVMKDIYFQWSLLSFVRQTLAERDSFLCLVLTGTLPDTAEPSPLSSLCGVPELRYLIATFVGVQRGRALRNARELAALLGANLGDESEDDSESESESEDP
jgi:hypothetical protein